MTTSENPRTCLIGAGSSGIAAAKALHERGMPFDCYELGDRVGGNWVFQNKNGISSSYRSLHINTSRERMEFSDYPMPKSYPDFPRHDHIARYFDDYVDHFGFRDQIKFGVGVEHVERLDDGRWEVRTTTGETEVYDALIVANGHHWDPRWPEPPFPGSDTFEGEQIHSHDYKEETQIVDRDVVVLGMGNSAMDIAVDASYHSRNTYLAARRGAYVIPKYMFGKPFDQIGGAEWMPHWIRFPVMSRLLRFNVGRMQDFGLPEPDHKFAHAHPTVSGRILDRLAHGAITPKPNIAALEGDKVRFTDGSEVHADLVVYCTGYKITFPFFDEDFISAPDNAIELYRRVFHPEVPNVFFVGLLQPLGAVMPLAEAQGRWIAEYLRGEYALPGELELRREMAADRAAMDDRYVSSKRHTIQVDFDDYLFELDRERRHGRERARRDGFARPVAALVAGEAQASPA